MILVTCIVQGSLLELAPDSVNEDKAKEEESSESELSSSDDDDQLKYVRMSEICMYACAYVCLGTVY